MYVWTFEREQTDRYQERKVYSWYKDNCHQASARKYHNCTGKFDWTFIMISCVFLHEYKHDITCYKYQCSGVYFAPGQYICKIWVWFLVQKKKDKRRKKGEDQRKNACYQHDTLDLRATPNPTLPPSCSLTHTYNHNCCIAFSHFSTRS